MPGKGRGAAKENTKFGTSQDDTLDGSGGSFVLSGGRGDDTYLVDDLADSIAEKNNGGANDRVVSSVDWTLEDNVEHLTLTGEEDLAGTGNELNNDILGNAGANLLTGGLGDDTLDGGDGIDSAVFAGDRADYVISVGETITTITNVATGETDQLSNIELVVFDDQTVDISPPEPVPLSAIADSGQTNEDTSVVIDLLANDAGQGLEIIAVSAGSMGTVTNNGDGTVTYIPFAHANGTDSFSYTIRDTNGSEASASVEVDVLAVNDAPIAQDDQFEVGDSPQLSGALNVLSNDQDLDGDPLFVASAGGQAADMASIAEAGGHLSFATENGGLVEIHPDGSFTYEAATGYSGTDGFTYLASDASSATAMATVELNVSTSPTEPPSGDVPYYVDALLPGDFYRLNYGDPIGTPVTLNFAFADEKPSYYGTEADESFQSFTAEQRANTLAALEQIASFAGVTFVETSVEEAEMVFGITDLGFSGLAYLPYGDGTGNTGSDVWLDDGFANSDFAPGSAAYMTLVHEIGHGLGLTHPDLPEGEETQQYSIMTATRHPMMGLEETSGFMTYDIAALQYLYGTNQTETAGDDQYTYSDLAESIQTIWDAGGNDTLDMSAATEGVELDLNEGAFNSVGAATSYNIGLAFGTEIENAIGSSFDDVINGNDLNNLIVAGAGNDQLTGGGGSDTYRFDVASGSNSITDFDGVEDRIDLSGTGLTLNDLMTSVEEGGVAISFGETEILLEGQGSDSDLETWVVL